VLQGLISETDIKLIKWVPGMEFKGSSQSWQSPVIVNYHGPVRNPLTAIRICLWICCFPNVSISSLSVWSPWQYYTKNTNFEGHYIILFIYCEPFRTYGKRMYQLLWQSVTLHFDHRVGYIYRFRMILGINSFIFLSNLKKVIFVMDKCFLWGWKLILKHCLGDIYF
jgi:hypothetical protein